MSYCNDCGAEISANDKYCKQCGRVVSLEAKANDPYQSPSSKNASMRGSRHVDNHIVKAILVTLFCCMPFGVVSIVYASSVNCKLDDGNYSGAKMASDKANMWANLGIGFGLVGTLIYVALQIFIASNPY